MATKKIATLETITYFWGKLKAYFVKAEAGKGLSTNDFDEAAKTKLDGLKNYELPEASATVLGGIKVGSGLNIADGGVLSTAPVTGFAAEDHTHTTADITDLDDKGYQTAADVESTLSGKGYQTAEDVEGTLAGKGYQTASDVQNTLTTGEYQTKTEVEAAIAAAGSTHLTRVVLGEEDELPTEEEAKENVVYMKKNPAGSGQNVYDEYLWMADTKSFEHIGSSDVDLSAYLKDADLVAISNAEIDTLMADEAGGEDGA